MYNAHRGMMPHQAPNNRLTELLEQIRVEFDTQAGSLGDSARQRDEMVSTQIRELELIREKIYQLEQQHISMKSELVARNDALQRELEARGGPSAAAHGGHPHGGPSQPAPPSIGHGPRDLFGQIMAGGGGQGQSSLAPPPQEPPQPQGLPAHLTQGVGLSTGPPVSQHAPFANYQPPPGVNGYGPQPPQATASPGPGKPRVPRGPPGAATPQQPPHRPPPFPQQQSHAPPPQQPPHQPIRDVGNALADLNVDELPPQYKKIGDASRPDDAWWVIYNPAIERKLDVNLVHTITHNSVVCCVRFSQDGRFIATGCNRAARIYDVESGQLVAHLEDLEADKEGDLYVRSVCFSPDGMYLATGAEDKIIRVWDIATNEIKAEFKGHEQDIYSLDFARNGRIIASGSGDRTVRLWDLETKSNLMTLSIEDGVTTVALSPDGRLVAAGSLDRSVRVWDTETATPIDRLEGERENGHTDSVYSVGFSPNGRQLVSGSLDRTIKMWELSPPPPRGAPNPPSKGTGRCIRTFEGHNDFVLSVAFTPDGAWVLSGSKDRGVQFWDPNTGHTQLHLQGHKNSVISVAPSPKGGLFATGSGDTKARIWSYEPYRGP